MKKQILDIDFQTHKNLNDAQAQHEILLAAHAVGKHGFGPLNLSESQIRGKRVFRNKHLPHDLVIRHLNAHVRAVTKVKQDNRDFIVSCLIQILVSGEAHRIYKFDIKSFYESVNVSNIISIFDNDIAFSSQMMRAFRSLFEEFSKINVTGLPRGMSISATLAEYLLREFDTSVSNLNGVRFYARFVDDIIIITSGTEVASEFSRLVTNCLPSGLEFNKKSCHHYCGPYLKSSSGVETIFSFLGYKFTISFTASKDRKHFRKVELDIADSKVKKIKTKIARALLAYKSNNDFALLHCRIKLLTSNFSFERQSSGALQKAGIYFNYPLIDASVSLALKNLDRYLRNVIASTHPNNQLKPNITNQQRLLLLKLTFEAGHKTRRFYNFTPEKLAQITSCWSYA